jgi:hypothetical protein
MWKFRSAGPIKSQNLAAGEEETQIGELEVKMETLLRGDTSDPSRESWASEKPTVESHRQCSLLVCHIQRSLQGRLDGSSIVPGPVQFPYGQDFLEACTVAY